MPPTRPRRLAVAMVVALFCATSLGPASIAQAAKAPPACSLVPQLRDVTVNQGVGAYMPLVRGKETLVRAFLSKPSCATTSSIIELTGGSLSVTPGTAAAVTISAPTPRPAAPFPQLAAATSAPLVDSTADPIFVVPGSVLAPNTTTARFTATFRITINYQSRTSSTATPVSGSFTFTSRSGSTTPISATVEKLTNALRVLVVPMGDPSKPFASQYTAAGDAALQAAMLTLSRIYPVPDGVGSLTGTTGGLRYSTSPGLLDLRGLLGADGRFCGTGGSNGNFNAIKASLGQFLQSWNAANGAANQADRVLGVVDEAISNGSTLGCAEGMAAINSNEAWIRAVPEKTGVPSQSGFVAALELGHTFGLVLGGPAPIVDRDDLFSKYHSPNIYADPQRTNRSYNTRLRSVLVDDRTAMTYIAAGNNNNTLLEQLDWTYLICRLGGATSTECPSPAVPVGSGAGVAAGPRFVISGVTNGTQAGTQVLESFFSANMLPTPPNAASPYRLVYRSSNGAILSNFGLPVQTEDSAHSHDDDGPEAPALTLFSGAFEFPGTPARLELWNGNPPGGTLLYARDRTAAPVITDLDVTPAGGGPQNFTNDSENVDFAPALSADGRWIAWPAFLPSEGTINIVVRVAPTDDISQQVRLSDGDDIDSTDPAWCADGARLAYVDPDDGGLWTVPVDTTSAPATFGTPSMIYDAGLPGNFLASHPTWSPDCSQLAFEADDDIWRIDSDGTDVVALTNDDSSHDPSWSPDPADNRIAFVVSGFSALREGGPLFADEGADAVFASFVNPDLDEPIVLQSHDGNHFTVTAADDTDDGDCTVGGHCSLREAINATNASPNIASTPDEIDFNIPGAGPHTISLGGPLPVIAEAVFIEGISQPGWSGTPLIEIDGTAADPGSVGVDGLVIGAPADVSRVRGVAVTGFSRDGIRVFADDTMIAFSYIGVAPDGSSGKGNGAIGIQVIGADRTIIGINSGVGGQNVISDNGQHGISVNGGSALDPVVGTKIGGNRIGTDAAGTTALGNAAYGIFLNAFAQNSLVGGLVAQERNVISANVFGIVVADGADVNTIQGNRIGTDVTGTADLGNTGAGIEVFDAAGTIIGDGAGAGNVIGGNGSLTEGAPGIRIRGSQAFGTMVRSNLIGVSATGLPLGNSTYGIEITDQASQNRIGATNPVFANTIAYNGEDGILVANDATGNTFRGDNIHDNGGLGIDLAPDGVTENDTDDPDSGANDLTNFPVITSAESVGSDATVNGTINSLPDSTQTIDFYVGSSCDPSGNGEGASWAGFQIVTVDSGGDAPFTQTLNGVVAGQVITATASEGVSNSTSEFGDCFTVTGPETATFTVNSTDDADDGLCGTTHCSLREAIDRANSQAGIDTISFSIGGGGTQTIAVTAALPVISEAVTIDGTTQPGYVGDPLVVVDGAAAGAATDGLVISSAPAAAGSTIQALAVVRFGGVGVDDQNDNTFILANWIGTANGIAGAANAVGLRLGGDTLQAEVRGNLIGGNLGAGIEVAGDEHAIHDNRIGTTAAGDFELANGGPGIDVVAGTALRVGSALGTDANLISGNTGPGIRVMAEASIQGNFIGTDVDGTSFLGNDGGGIVVDGGEASIGGGDSETNVISGNFQNGITVLDDGFALILGNFIGTDRNGTGPLGNTTHGIEIANAAATIGGPGSDRNIISGNNGYGILIRDTPGTGTLTAVNENYIGLDVIGTAAIGNAVGVVITNADNQIVGTDTGGSVISGNNGPGIIVNGTSTGNEIFANVIGLNHAADMPIPNGDAGIYIGPDTTATIIGGNTGVTPGLRNIIAGNTLDGIVIDGSVGNVVQGNLIGTNSESTDLGNGGAGVSILNGASANRVGADQSGTVIEDAPGNVIAFNSRNGIELVSAPVNDSDFNEIHSNSIFENGGLGIDLEADGVTPNDPGDGDDGANDLKNFPDEIEATSDGTETTITVTTTTSAAAEIIVYQVFASTSCDPSGFGEGEIVVGFVDTAADGTGFATATLTVPEDLEGMWLTATTSDNQGQTSEFSECFEVLAPPAGDEIHLLDPTTPLGTTELVVEGSDPAWRSGSLLYETNDEIHRILPDGTGDETITSGFVDAGPAGAPGVTAFAREQGGDQDIWLLVDGETVNVTATDATPQNLRLDLYYRCGGQAMPIAVGLSPNQTAGTTASFQTNFDPSLSCAGGTIEAALTDGFLRTTTPPGQGEPVASDPKPPVAATYGPPLGSTYLTSDVIPFHGIGEDADDGTLTGASLGWFIRPASAPCCGTPAGTGGSVDFDASGLAPGNYIVTLRVTDADGQIDIAESLIHVIGDSDHDGFSDSEETNTCFGAGAATNGSTPSGDADGDGLPNASDPEPCVRATVYNATADFDPDDLSLGSSGTPVTVFIRTPGRNIRQVVASSVKITTIGGVTVDIANVGWTISGDRATAKFPRQAITQFLNANGAAPGPTWFTISGQSNTNPMWRFEARDFTNVKP